MEGRTLLWILFSLCCMYMCTWCMEFETATSRSCASLCTYQSMCRSYDWDASRQSCRLTTEGVDDLRVNLQRPGHVCGMRPCPEHLVCVPTESATSYLCLGTLVDDTTSYDVKNGDCYTRNGYSYALPDDYTKYNDSMTLEYCDEYCTDFQKIYFGILHGSFCYCGDIIRSGYEKRTEAECDTPCAGDNEQKCGGTTSMLIYKTSEYP